MFIKEKKIMGEENSRIFEDKSYFLTGFTRNLDAFCNTVTYWLVWFFVILLRQPENATNYAT